MNKSIIFSIFALLFLAGCIDMIYTQKVSADGTSTIELDVDATKLLGMMGSQMPPEYLANVSAQLEASCVEARAQGVECKAEGTKIIKSRKFTPQDGVYSFESSGGLFGSKYKVAVNKIPVVSFSAGTGNTGMAGGQTEDIILSDKAKNVQTAAGMQQMQATMKYVVEMPAPITKATAGKYEAKIDGNRATFDLLEVMESSEPLVIEAEAGGGWALIAIIAVVVAVVLILLFFMFSRPKTPSS